MALYEHRQSMKLHGDPGGGITLCGQPCLSERRWSLLNPFGSLYDIDCKRCIAVLRKSGDLPAVPAQAGQKEEGE